MIRYWVAHPFFENFFVSFYAYLMAMNVTILDVVVLSWNKIIVNVNPTYSNFSTLKWIVIVKTLLVAVGELPFVILFFITLDKTFELVGIVGLTIIIVIDMIFLLGIFVYSCIIFYKFLKSSSEQKYKLLRNKV